MARSHKSRKAKARPASNSCAAVAQASPAFAEAVAGGPAADLAPSSQILGDAGSASALKEIQSHTSLLKRKDLVKLLQDALASFRKGDWTAGGDLALKALHIDEKCGEAWHVLAVSRDKSNDLATALTCYETALRLMPENPAVANDLGRLAYRLGHTEMASRFFRFFLGKCPGHTEAINNLASTLRELNRIDEAIDLLKDALQANPNQPSLWNVLGTAVNAKGDTATAAVFYEQAAKLDPKNVHAIYNLGNARAVMGDIDGGIAELLRANEMFVDPMHLYTCRLSLGFGYLAKGDLENGWRWYEARQKQGTIEQIRYMAPRPRWTPEDSLHGKRIFVSAEQGLGDEIMFGTTLPDLIREVGPEGHVTIAVEKRLVSLFQRSFPEQTIVKHHTTKHNNRPVRLFPDVTNWESYDHWALMGDFLSRYRSRVEDFPARSDFLKPDTVRVQYWRDQLSALNDKPKVGVLWKSLINHSRRNRHYSPFATWMEVLSAEGIQFINLQYGDSAAEMEEAKAMGLDIWTPPGIDLKDDLDDLSALCAAMDCLLGPANATSNIAGSVGCKVWMLTHERSWNCLGTDHFPWYKTTRIFLSDSMLDWSRPMLEMRQALIETFVEGPHGARDVA